MKVVFHYNAGPQLIGEFEKLASAGLEIEVCGESDTAALDRLLPDVEVLWHVLQPLTADHIGRAARLRLIQKIGVGVNTIDLPAARRAGIRVCNMPGTNSRAVAEHTLALMLAVLRRLAQYDRATRAGAGWDLPLAVQEQLGEIGGRRVGLVGFGAVPRILAPVLAAMGADVSYTAPRAKPVAATYKTLATLLAESDIVSLHLPLTAETANLMDADAIAAMKPGAILVNTARGGLVDRTALHQALVSGHLSAAGLDVFAEEPVTASEPLMELENVVVTPHIAWLTRETMTRSIAVAAENCRRLAAGEPLLHQVV